jgi:hypothetical protein
MGRVCKNTKNPERCFGESTGIGYFRATTSPVSSKSGVPLSFATAPFTPPSDGPELTCQQDHGSSRPESPPPTSSPASSRYPTRSFSFASLMQVQLSVDRQGGKIGQGDYEPTHCSLPSLDSKPSDWRCWRTMTDRWVVPSLWPFPIALFALCRVFLGDKLA